MESKKITLSFTMLNDLKSIIMIHEEVNNDYKSVLAFVKKISALYTSFDKYDPSHFFAHTLMRQSNINEYEMSNIATDIWENDFYVCNRLEKYYVVAFAKNYTKFDVFSKDCPKEIIDWKVNVKSAYKGRIMNPNYNENPVITMLKKLNN